MTPVLRPAVGLILVVVPAPLLRRLAGRPPGRREIALARVLGARHLLESAVLCRDGDLLPVLRLADGVHAASMVALAALSGRHRRVALGAAGAAVLVAVAP